VGCSEQLERLGSSRHHKGGCRSDSSWRCLGPCSGFVCFGQQGQGSVFRRGGCRCIVHRRPRPRGKGVRTRHGGPDHTIVASPLATLLGQNLGCRHTYITTSIAATPLSGCIVAGTASASMDTRSSSCHSTAAVRAGWLRTWPPDFWTAITGPRSARRRGNRQIRCATHRRRRRKHRVAGHVGGLVGQFPKSSDLRSSVGRGLLGSGNRQCGILRNGQGCA
jgi:hypothetical protein